MVVSIPNIARSISTILAKANANIADLPNKSRGDISDTIIELDDTVEESTLDSLRGIEGVLSLRHLPAVG